MKMVIAAQELIHENGSAEKINSVSHCFADQLHWKMPNRTIMRDVCK
jgi:hypothetical protein